MRLDASVNFVPPGSPLSLVGIAGSTFPSLVVDLLGQGVGTAPANIIGNVATFGVDPGVGRYLPHTETVIGTAAATATSATLNVQFQAAPDTGSGGGYAAGAWQTLMETGALTAAQLTAGQIIARFPFPPSFPVNLRPRYLRLLFVPLATASFTALTIAYSIVTTVRDDQANKFVPNNYAAR